MIRYSFRITDPAGMHAQPAVRLVAAATPFVSRCVLKVGNEQVDVKSILALMQSGLKMGDSVVLEVDGPDEVEALETLKVALELNE